MNNFVPQNPASAKTSISRARKLLSILFLVIALASIILFFSLGSGINLLKGENSNLLFDVCTLLAFSICVTLWNILSHPGGRISSSSFPASWKK